MFKALFNQKNAASLIFPAVMMASLTMSACTTGHRDSASQDAVSVSSLTKKGPDASNATGKPTALELEARLMGFADRYLSKAAEATDNYQHKVKTRASRDLGLATFIFPGLTVIGIAAGGDPASDLLDMVVFTTLQREAMESGWAQEVLGKDAEPLIHTQRQLEEQIWAIAADILTLEQQAGLRNIIRGWRKANPNQRYVSNVKFDDVAVVRGVDQKEKSLVEESDGLFAPLDEAVRETTEIRLMARRSIYLMQRMPPLLLAQARYLVHEEISPEQVEGLLKDISGFKQSVSDAQKTLAQLPESFGKERAALFNDLDKLTPVLANGQVMTNDVRAAVESFNNIVKEYPGAGSVLNETLHQYRELMVAMSKEPPSDLSPKIELLREIGHIGEELNRLAVEVRSMDQEKARLFVAELLNGVLIRAMGFAVFIMGLFICYRWLIRRVDILK
jgi:hypothetical protein